MIYNPSCWTQVEYSAIPSALAFNLATYKDWHIWRSIAITRTNGLVHFLFKYCTCVVDLHVTILDGPNISDIFAALLQIRSLRRLVLKVSTESSAKKVEQFKIASIPACRDLTLLNLSDTKLEFSPTTFTTITSVSSKMHR